MFLSVLSYLPYAAVTAYTPGPNNVVALYSVSRDGWRKGKNTLCGIAAGFLCVMILCALFCYELAKFIPSVTGIMKYIGAAYIIWLAIHVARSGPDQSEGQTVTFWQGFCLQFVNVKIILYAITVYTGYVLPETTSLPVLLFHAVCLAAIGVSGNFVWAAAGGVLQRFLVKHYRVFNLVMGAVLILCALKLLK